MTPEERELIAGLFERMRSVGTIDKDREAESYINQSVRQFPDAPYLLVQSVLVQEHALQDAQARVQELEDRVRDLEQARPRSSGSGSFLGSIFGGGRPAERAPEPRGSGSVPPIGSRSAPSAYDAPQGASPWGGQPGPGGYGQPAAPQGGGGGGGFMRSAMSTAAGVAGGVLAAEAIRNMMGGSAGHAHAATTTADPAKSTTTESSPYEVNQNEDKPEEAHHQEAHYQDADDNDPGNYDADDSSWGSDDIDV
jgi:hypothetical protein